MGNSFVEILAKKKATIAKEWFQLAIQAYAPDTVEFLKNKSDPFANPVGSTTLRGIQGLLDQLIHGMDRDAITSFLDPIIRIRAIQNFTPSQATGFIVILKKVLRENFVKELRDTQIAREFLEFEANIDRLCLMAFDIYMQCREKIYQISASEMKNRTFKAFERAGLISEESG